MRRYQLLATAAAVFALGTAPLSAQGKSGNAPKGGAPKTTSTAPATHGNSAGAKNPNAGGPKASAPTTTASGAGTTTAPSTTTASAPKNNGNGLGAAKKTGTAPTTTNASTTAPAAHGRQHDHHADNDDRNGDHHSPRHCRRPQPVSIKVSGQSRPVGESAGDAAPRHDARAGQQRLPQPGPVHRGVERVEEPRAGVRRPAKGDDGGRHEPGSGRQVRPDVAAGASSDSLTPDAPTAPPPNDRYDDANGSGRDDDHVRDHHRVAEVVARYQ